MIRYFKVLVSREIVVSVDREVSDDQFEALIADRFPKEDYSVIEWSETSAQPVTAPEE